MNNPTPTLTLTQHVLQIASTLLLAWIYQKVKVAGLKGSTCDPRTRPFLLYHVKGIVAGKDWWGLSAKNGRGWSVATFWQSSVSTTIRIELCLCQSGSQNGQDRRPCILDIVLTLRGSALQLLFGPVTNVDHLQLEGRCSNNNCGWIKARVGEEMKIIGGPRKGENNTEDRDQNNCKPFMPCPDGPRTYSMVCYEAHSCFLGRFLGRS